jgi:hypothetical protein
MKSIHAAPLPRPWTVAEPRTRVLPIPGRARTPNGNLRSHPVAEFWAPTGRIFGTDRRQLGRSTEHLEFSWPRTETHISAYLDLPVSASRMLGSTID